MASTGLNEVKKTAKREMMDFLVEALHDEGYETVDGADLGIKGSALVIRGVSTDKGVCDLKITLTAPARGTEY